MCAADKALPLADGHFGNLGMGFFLILFFMWIIIKVSIEFVTILFMFWFFGHKACGMLAPPLGIKSSSLPLEDKS